jgi:hypothetical protein
MATRGCDGGIRKELAAGVSGAPNDPADAKKPRPHTRDMGLGPTCALMSTRPTRRQAGLPTRNTRPAES